MHWMTILGIVLITIGTLLTYLGQNANSKSDIDSLQTSIREKNTHIDELVKGNEELLIKIDEYQKTVSDKNEVIEELEEAVDKLHLTAPTLLPGGQLEIGSGITVSSDFSRGMGRARKAFNQNDFDEAQRIAEELKEKNSEFGPAYFILGTIALQGGDSSRAEELLNHALTLELPDNDKAAAHQNLGIVALRAQRHQDAIHHFEKAVEYDPKMEESRKAARELREQLKKQ